MTNEEMMIISAAMRDAMEEMVEERKIERERERREGDGKREKDKERQREREREKERQRGEWKRVIA